MRQFRSLLAKVVRVTAPDLYWQRRIRQLQRATDEQEMCLVPALCVPKQLGVDVGASHGLYSAKILGCGVSCVACEPLLLPAQELRQIARASGLPLRVEQVALSDQEGETTLRVLTEALGRSTIEPENLLLDEDPSPRETVTVRMRTLDSYGLDPVGFMKVDVEGHELAVLRGAKHTLQTYQPRLLVEAEDRHRPNTVRDTYAFLRELGYTGYFILDGSLNDIDSFESETHQNPMNIGGWRSGYKRYGVYVNNFIFVSEKEAEMLRPRLQAQLIPDFRL